LQSKTRREARTSFDSPPAVSTQLSSSKGLLILPPSKPTLQLYTVSRPNLKLRHRPRQHDHVCHKRTPQ
jgi:hypothetical protein